MQFEPTRLHQLCCKHCGQVFLSYHNFNYETIRRPTLYPYRLSYSMRRILTSRPIKSAEIIKIFNPAIKIAHIPRKSNAAISLLSTVSGVVSPLCLNKNSFNPIKFSFPKIWFGPARFAETRRGW